MSSPYVRAVLEEVIEQRRRKMASLYAKKRCLFGKYPALAEADKALRNQLTANAQDHSAQQMYDEQLARALAAEDMPADALTFKPQCALCMDTGFNNGEVCSCVLNEAARRMASIRSDEVNFSQFDLNVFPEDVFVREGVTQRDYMARLLEICRKFCEDFPQGSYQNLILEGQSGVGKTFMLKCIKARLEERGFSTIMITAYRLNELMARAMVGQADLTPFLDCDALFIDDLGTEPIFRNVTLNSFFHLFNERTEARKSFIVSTNLNSGELRNRYEERVYSRLMDAKKTHLIRITGKDIRRNRG